MSQKRKHPAVNKEVRRLSESAINRIRSAADIEDRLKVIQSFVKIKNSWIDEVLCLALDDKCEKIRDYIIKELAKREDLNLNLLYKKLHSSPWYVKSSIMKILAILKQDQTVQHIENILNEPNADVRANAAFALGEIGGSDSVRLLTQLLNDNNKFVRKSASEALRRVSHIKFI